MPGACGTRQQPSHETPNLDGNIFLSRGAACPHSCPAWEVGSRAGAAALGLRGLAWRQGCAGDAIFRLYLCPSLSRGDSSLAPEASPSGPKEMRGRKPRAELQGSEDGPRYSRRVGRSKMNCEVSDLQLWWLVFTSPYRSLNCPNYQNENVLLS